MRCMMILLDAMLDPKAGTTATERMTFALDFDLTRVAAVVQKRCRGEFAEADNSHAISVHLEQILEKMWNDKVKAASEMVAGGGGMTSGGSGTSAAEIEMAQSDHTMPEDISIGADGSAPYSASIDGRREGKGTRAAAAALRHQNTLLREVNSSLTDKLEDLTAQLEALAVQRDALMLAAYPDGTGVASEGLFISSAKGCCTNTTTTTCTADAKEDACRSKSPPRYGDAPSSSNRRSAAAACSLRALCSARSGRRRRCARQALTVRWKWIRLRTRQSPRRGRPVWLVGLRRRQGEGYY